MSNNRYRYVFETPSRVKDHIYMSNGSINILVHKLKLEEYLSKGYIKGMCKPYLIYE